MFSSFSGSFKFGRRASNILPIPSSILYLDARDYVGSGTIWTADKGSNATLFNTPTYVASSPEHFSFDNASGEYATVPDLGDLDQWTVESWFRLDNTLTSSNITAVVCSEFDLIDKLNFSIGTNRAPVSANMCVGFYDGAWRTTSGFSASADVWYHIVGTYDGNTVRQYVDGSQQSILTYSGTPKSGGEVRMARRWDGEVDANNIFPGDIGLVRIWNTALNVDRVSELYDENSNRFIV